MAAAKAPQTTRVRRDTELAARTGLRMGSFLGMGVSLADLSDADLAALGRMRGQNQLGGESRARSAGLGLPNTSGS